MASCFDGRHSETEIKVIISVATIQKGRYLSYPLPVPLTHDLASLQVDSTEEPDQPAHPFVVDPGRALELPRILAEYTWLDDPASWRQY